MGMMMDECVSRTLCLAENQFGYVILQGFEIMSWQEHIPNRSAILSVPDGDIPAYGYVEIAAEGRNGRLARRLPDAIKAYCDS